MALAFWSNTWHVRDRLFGSPGRATIEALAVLPLDNLSRDPEQEFFADGMTEALIADLGRIRITPGHVADLRRWVLDCGDLRGPR